MVAFTQLAVDLLQSLAVMLLSLAFLLHATGHRRSK